MSSKTEMVANLTLDMKRNRIRIYRATLRALGDPAYIQFLINPEELYIAILGSEIPLSGGTANRVKIPNSRLDGKLSVEFYSAALLDGIYSIFGVLDREYNYRLTGEIDQVNRVAYFSLRTLKRIERRKLNDGQGVYEVFMANIEAGSDKQLIIRDLVESYSLSIGQVKGYGVICAVSALEGIYDKFGYHVLDRTLRLCAGTWEGDMNSLCANFLNGVARLVNTYGDKLKDELFKERVGATSVKQLTRNAKERRPGSLGFAEAMLVAYNRKCKYPLVWNKLYEKNLGTSDALDVDVDLPDDEMDEAETVEE